MKASKESTAGRLFLVTRLATNVERVVSTRWQSNAALPRNSAALSADSCAHRKTRYGCACSEQPSHLTGAEGCAAQKLETGWLLAQALRSQPESVW